MKIHPSILLLRVKIFILLILILLQSIILYKLFLKSIEINGDIQSYLEFIKGNPLELTFDFEPVSFVIFKFIGVFPENFHFAILYIVSLIGLILSNYIIFKKTKGSLSWVLFYGICIMPFACAINLRTGYGFLFLLLFGFRRVTVFLLPLFHASLATFLVALRMRMNFLRILLIFVLLMFFTYIIGDLVLNKFSSYLLYYLQGQSILGIIIELFILSLFTIYFFKIYTPLNRFLLQRVIVTLFLISIVFSPIAIISSRFITLIYFALIISRFYSIKKVKSSKSLISFKNLIFSGLFVGLFLFRMYRILTMFGYSEPL